MTPQCTLYDKMLYGIIMTGPYKCTQISWSTVKTLAIVSVLTMPDLMAVWQPGVVGGSLYTHHPTTTMTIKSDHPQNGHLTHQGRDDMAAILQTIFLNENFRILNSISQKYLPNGVIDNMAALV